MTAVWTGTPLDTKYPLDNINLAGRPYPVVFGASISAPVWKGIMDYALRNEPNADFPAPSAKIATGDPQPFSPSPIGYSVATATSILQAQGYQVVVGGSIASNYRPGIVAGTSPRGGAPVGSTVNIFTSSGPGSGFVSGGNGPGPAGGAPRPGGNSG